MEENTFQRDPLKSILQKISLDYIEPSIGILRRNPFQVFVYWELPKVTKREGEEYFLRLIDNTKDEFRIISLVKIDDINNNRYYIDIPPEVKKCEAELVVLKPQGKEKILISTIKDNKKRKKVEFATPYLMNSIEIDKEKIIICDAKKAPLHPLQKNISSIEQKRRDVVEIPSSWSGKKA